MEMLHSMWISFMGFLGTLVGILLGVIVSSWPVLFLLAGIYACHKAKRTFLLFVLVFLTTEFFGSRCYFIVATASELIVSSF